MSECREAYLNNTGRWIDIRFDDGKHTGVRVRLGTTVIEIQREGRQKIVDVTECKTIDPMVKSVYSK